MSAKVKTYRLRYLYIAVLSFSGAPSRLQIFHVRVTAPDKQTAFSMGYKRLKRFGGFFVMGKAVRL